MQRSAVRVVVFIGLYRLVCRGRHIAGRFSIKIKNKTFHIATRASLATEDQRFIRAA
jgi:hypothetical protein